MDVAMEEEPPIKETTADTNEHRIKEIITTTAATVDTNENPIKTTITSTNETTTTPVATAVGSIAAAKTLKRCLSVPNIGRGMQGSSMTLRSAAAAAALKRTIHAQHEVALATAAAATIVGEQQIVDVNQLLETPKKHVTTTAAQGLTAAALVGNNNYQHHHHQHHHHRNFIPRSNPSSREVSPAPMFNIFAPRARRYSASFSPLGNVSSSGNGAPLCLTPRVSQLRKEECADVNTREVNHEREVHSAMQMSQSWEDLTLVAENWSFKSDELTNALQVTLPAAITSCSSPSPTSNRPNMRLPYGLSPSPTRRTFATRRSMSPIAMRPSQLGPVKRKFDLDEQNSNLSNWSVYSPPPLKKIFTESRGTSPICQSPSSVCPSPDSGTYDGRITPKLFISKLCTANTNASGTNNNSNSSNCSSPSSNCSLGNTLSLGLASKSNSSTSNTCGGGSEPMCLVDEGISISDSAVTTSSSAGSTPAQVSGDMQDEATMMDDTKSETSSIGGCSSISMESTSSNTFLNRFNSDSELGSVTSSLVPKHYFINKLGGLSGAKKYIVNHDHSDSNLSVSSTTTTMGVSNELLENPVPPTIMVDNKI